MKPDQHTRRMDNHETEESGCHSGPSHARRDLLTATGFAGLALGLSSIAYGQTIEAIPQPPEPNEETFMKRAFGMRQAAIDKGDQAYGAVIVRDGVIVGQSWSRVNIDQDPTAHAEMAAIRDAAQRLDSRDLSGTVMYSSSRPCPMCEAAAYWAGVGQMIYGRDLVKGGFPKLCR